MEGDKKEVETGVESSRKQLSRIMKLGGTIGLFFGGIHLATYLSSGLSAALADAIFNAGYGALFLIGAAFAARGKAVTIAFQVAAVLASLVYAYAIGRGFNYISLALGGAFIVWTISLWRRGALA